MNIHYPICSKCSSAMKYGVTHDVILANDADPIEAWWCEKCGVGFSHGVSFSVREASDRSYRSFQPANLNLISDEINLVTAESRRQSLYRAKFLAADAAWMAIALIFWLSMGTMIVDGIDIGRGILGSILFAIATFKATIAIFEYLSIFRRRKN